MPPVAAYSSSPTVCRPLNRREAAEFLGVTRGCLARWAQQAKGPRYARTGGQKGRVLYELDDLLAWLEERKRW
jgi:predicted DNA-binding transcriptional regulator AlpA